MHTVDLFKQLGWTGKTFGMFAIHNWTLTENDGKTKVSIEESLEGLFAKLLKNCSLTHFVAFPKNRTA